MGARTARRDDIVAVAIAIGCVTAITIITASTFVWTDLAITLGPLAGFATALARPRPSLAALAAPLGILLGTLAFNVLTVVPTWDTTLLTGDRLAALGIAAASAFAFSYIARTRPDFTPLLAGAAVAVLVLTVWLGTMTAAGTPNPASGLTPCEVLKGTPSFSEDLSDEGLYLLYVRSVAAGEDYYATVLGVLVRMNELRPADIDVTSPFAYRPPTLYRLLSALPNNGVSYIAALLAVGSAAAVSAFSLARRFVAPSLALTGAAAVGAYYAGHARGVAVVQSEVWTGGLALVALAFIFAARSAPRRRALALASVGALAALIGALVRELGVAVLLAGLGALLLDRETRERRLWVPWLVALGLAAAAFAWHAASVAEVVAQIPAGAAHTGAGSASAAMWFNPDGRALYSAVWTLMWIWGLPWQPGWVLVGLGVLGAALTLERDRADRLFLAALVVAGTLAITVLRPRGEMHTGMAPYYWAGVVMPAVLATMPLAFSRVRALASGASGSDATAGPQASDEPGADAADQPGGS